MMQTYKKDRKLIPGGQLVEIEYADLVQEPEETLRYIYEGLGLGEFDKTKSSFATYVQKKKGYKVSQYKYSQEEEDMIQEMEERFEPMVKQKTS